MNKGLLAAIVAIVAIALLAVLFVMGNKDDNSYSGNTGDTTTNEQTTAPGTGGQDPGAGESPDGVEATEVSIKDSGFNPVNIKVKKGVTVTWTNNGDLPHNVVSEADGGPKSETLQPGDTYTFTFNTVGTFDYICTFHPSMTGKVTVTE